MFRSTGEARVLIRHGWLVVHALVLAGYSTLGLGGTPQLIRNINTVVVPESSNPEFLGVVGGKMLFGASDATGPALWATDGTTAGTVLVSRVNVLAQITFPGSPNFAVMGGKGYFVGNDGTNGPQLWSTDGTASGTAIVANLGPSGTTGSPVLFGVFGSQLIFTKVDASGISQLYATDGTSAGTQALTSLTGQGSYVGSEFLVVGQKFYFTTGGISGGAAAGQIWVSDGTPGGTRQVSNPSSYNGALYHPHAFTRVGTSFLFFSDGLLWSVDTTTDTIGAVTASGGTPGFGPPTVNENGGLIGMNGFALFLVTNSDEELWRSDGTTAGTYLVAVVNPGPLSFTAQQSPLLEKVGNRVILIGSDAQYGSQLWGSDGTSANTVRLTDATEPANVIFQIAIYHATLAGTAYVSLPDGAQTTTWSVWRTDGTVAGTQRANGLPSIDQSQAGITRVTGDSTIVYAEITSPSNTTTLYKYDPVADAATTLNTSLVTSIPDAFLSDGGALYLSTNDPVTGDEPWVSDGTPAGTHLLADINPQAGDSSSDPDEFVDLNGALAFVADDGVHGRELWTSDGTTAGTTLLADVNPGAASSNPSQLFVAGGVLYFFATDATGTQKFMSLSGSPASVTALASLAPMQPGTQVPTCSQDTPAVLNGKVYFAANDGVTGVELWSTDGTAAGTQRVADINPGAGDSNPCQLTVLGDRLYFAATGPDGNELWTSDGTAAGTTQVIDIAPGTASSNPSGLMVLNGEVYFGANDGTHGEQLWQSNGTASGTAPFGNIVQNAYSGAIPFDVVNGKLLIRAWIAQSQSATVPYQLWASDGTTQGTSSLGAPLSLQAAYLTSGSLAFFSSPGAVGPEPWVTDGTSAGTRLLKDINPTAQSQLIWFNDFNGVTLFATTDPSYGEELWRSDGTAAGTTLISAILQDATVSRVTAASSRHQLTVGQTFFFVGTDPATGSELYGLANDPPIANPVQATSTDDQQVSIDVLSNDSDPDGSVDSSSVQIATAPTHGTALVQSNGTILYTPTAGFSGTDTFTYTVKDNQGAVSSPGTVSITVTAAATGGGGAASGSGGHGGGGGAVDPLELLGLLVIAASRLAAARRRGA